LAESILVVDDDVALAKVLCAILAQAKYKAATVGDANAALAVIEKGDIDLVLTDVRMPGMDGFGLLAAVREKWSDIPVVMMTAHGSVPMAVEAIKQGAADFVLKPFENENLKAVIAKVLGNTASARNAPPAQSRSTNVGGLFGTTPAMVEIQARITRVAQSVAPVLILGENGTGKEVVAKEIHRQSARATKPLVAVNCGGMQGTLIENELFGHGSGAFTGASAKGKPGRVEIAEGGTLFLDEIGDLPLEFQVKLLRLLQEKTYERVGETQARKADVRFLAATNRNLEQMVREGKFREDLYHRLNVVDIRLPPLRERKGDISPLARMFLASFAKENGRPKMSIDDGAIARLEAQPWPGNVRQLQNFIQRLVVLVPGEVITASEVDAELSRVSPIGAAPAEGESSASKLDDHRKDAERKAVLAALKQANGNRTKAADILGVSRRTLYNKLEELGITDA
jgi:DNA-binding NtrC family response regulator